jgi:hypothetical protein
MHIKSVNRGLTFTKPGIYSIGLVLCVGLIAIASAVNGLYLFLSLALSILIISGLLSEATMRAVNVIDGQSKIVDAGEPFSLKISVKNRSNLFYIYGVGIYCFERRPRYRIFSGSKNHILSALVKELHPGQTIEVVAKSSGLSRGRYRNLYVLQSTTFPFGLLEKYKLSNRAFDIVALPPYDPVFGAELQLGLRRTVIPAGNDREFYGHRPYRFRDAIKIVDWKKSASKPSDAWVAKEFRSYMPSTKVLVQIEWEEVRAAHDETAYEQFLRQVRTAIDVCTSMGLVAGLDLPNIIQTWKPEQIARVIGGLPEFDDRSKEFLISEAVESPIARDFVLSIGLNSWRLSEPAGVQRIGGPK